MSQVAVEHATTIQNLMTAYKGESNARARYIAFAVKADADGLQGAASLFRAAAHAEKIHADNHARVLKQFGGEPTDGVNPVGVNTTLENLKTALAGERYEVDTMYPGFLKEATETKNAAAMRTFHFALEAEKAHARLFQEAITLVEFGPEDSWVDKARNFYVCPVCGYTSETPEEHKRCPVCNCLWKQFDVIR
jgi:rubrerythrin